MDWAFLEYCYCTILGRDREEFYESSLQDICNQIETHNKVHEEQQKQQNAMNKRGKQGRTTTSSERFSFGRAPELDF